MTTEWLMDAATNMLCLLKDGNKIMLDKNFFFPHSVLMIVNEGGYYCKNMLLKS